MTFTGYKTNFELNRYLIIKALQIRKQIICIFKESEINVYNTLYHKHI
jgi:hypothetical protein